MTEFSAPPQPPPKKPRSIWTDAQRQAAAERCRAQQPWQHSTGPRTPDGKSISSQNARKHGNYARDMLEFYRNARGLIAGNKRLVAYYLALGRVFARLEKKFSWNELSSSPFLREKFPPSFFTNPAPDMCPIGATG